jgi:hypothetical protein
MNKRFRSKIANFNYSTLFSPSVIKTQPPIQLVPAAYFPGVKWPRHEVDYASPSSAKVKNMWRYTSISPYVFMASQGLYLHLTNHYHNFFYICTCLFPPINGSRKLWPFTTCLGKPICSLPFLPFCGWFYGRCLLILQNKHSHNFSQWMCINIKMYSS